MDFCHAIFHLCIHFRPAYFLHKVCINSTINDNCFNVMCRYSVKITYIAHWKIEFFMYSMVKMQVHVIGIWRKKSILIPLCISKIEFYYNSNSNELNEVNIHFIAIFWFTECCWRIKVAFTNGHSDTPVYKLHRYIYGYYEMEQGTINGRNHYTSVHGDGIFALAFCGDR